MTATRNVMPVREALLSNSPLLPKVQSGMAAVKGSHHRYFATDVRDAFGDSLDLDEAMRQVHDRENRWDYLLGHTASLEIIAIEPHAARRDQVSTVIKKRAAARDQLRSHMKTSARISKWLWVASDKVHFADTEGVRRLLDQNGIAFVGRAVLKKHLPAGMPPRRRTGP